MINSKKEISRLKRISRLTKKDIVDISYKAHVGHIGSALSIADILTVLYLSILNVDPKKPFDKNRDRFVLSKGHAAAALYSVLCRKGYFPRKDLLSFCDEGGIFGTHPVYDLKLGIELSTGSLGHGLSVGVGLALGLRKNSKTKKSTPKVFVLLSDAELNEGSTWEAIMFAGHHKLDNLVVIVDDNNFQAFGKASEVINMQPVEKKLDLFGWEYKIIDGHNIEDLLSTLASLPLMQSRPSIIIAKTKSAKGISFLEDTQEAHYLPLDGKGYKKALKDIAKS
jgi:transketolase